MPLTIDKAISAGTAVASIGRAILSNSNNMSFGVNGQTITAKAAVNFYALGNTTQNASTVLDANAVSFNGLGAMTVGFSNGSIQLSAPVPTQSNQNISFFGLGNTTQNASTVLNANAVSFNGLGAMTVGYSNGSIQMSVPTQTNQNISFYGLGNTTQNASTVLNASVVSFNGLGAMTVGYSNGSIQMSVPTQTNQNISFYALGNTTQNSSSVLNASAVSINGLGIITAGYSNGSIQLSATQSNQNISFYALGNTTQNSSTVLNASVVSYNGLGEISVGYSNGSIQISGPREATLSMYPSFLPASTAVSTYYSGSTSQGAGGNSTRTGYTFSIYVVPIQLDAAVAFSNLRMAVSNGTVGGTGSVTHVYSVGIYTNNANTLSLVKDYYGGIMLSQNSSNAWTYSVFTVSTGGATAGGGGGFAGLAISSVQSSQGNVNSSLLINGSMKNIRIDNGVATTLTAGQYWLAFANCTVSAGSNVYSNAGFMQSNAISSVGLLDMGVNTAASAASLGGWGAISTTFSSNSNAASFFPMPNGIALTDMTGNSTSVQRYHFAMMRNL